MLYWHKPTSAQGCFIWICQTKRGVWCLSAAVAVATAAAAATDVMPVVLLLLLLLLSTAVESLYTLYRLCLCSVRALPFSFQLSSALTHSLARPFVRSHAC